MQLLLNPANIEPYNNGSSKPNNKTLKKKVNFMNNELSSEKHKSTEPKKKIDQKLLDSLTNENNEDNEDDTHIKEMYANYNDLYNETTINNIRNTIMNSVKKTNSDYSEDNEISDLKNDSKSNYNENYKLNYNDFNNNNNIINNNNKLLDKIDYIIHLLEEQHNEKTNNITEELILYLFLGIFIIYVLDSFSRMSKYKR